MRKTMQCGPWKNTEDEILEVGVTKYGLNQWSRISSLLVRKSPQQCKARWYQWLHPCIIKTDWTQQEDEKLLHLSKLLPCQWRSIAPFVGRTPSQCLQRYERLLDAACAKDGTYEAGDDPRKLRHGEIDPNPESKPACPDPVDMDEEEKEMLSVARARLSNMRGKKAKRKLREKQLEEARRLTSLQRTRELKAAGLDRRLRKKQRKGIDYNAEIPFEKRPPLGFYDVTDDSPVVYQPQFPTTIEELEGEKRDDKEVRLRKIDVASNKIALRHDAPSALLQASKINDSVTARKRQTMNLPTPQVPDYHINEETEMRDSIKLKRVRQADMRRNLCSGLTDLPQPKNEYLLTVEPVPVDDEEPEEKMEEDMCDRIAHVKAEKEEAKLLRVAMGHDHEDIDEFVELHKTCFNDVNVYAFSSVAGNMEELAALQKEFDAVKKRLDDCTKKALRSEQKIKLLTNGYKMRAARIWSQIEATFNDMVKAETDYECFEALKRQEQLAASNLISSIREDVQKQKDSEKNLQNRYGDMLCLTGQANLVDVDEDRPLLDPLSGHGGRLMDQCILNNWDVRGVILDAYLCLEKGRNEDSQSPRFLVRKFTSRQRWCSLRGR